MDIYAPVAEISRSICSMGGLTHQLKEAMHFGSDRIADRADEREAGAMAGQLSRRSKDR